MKSLSFKTKLSLIVGSAVVGLLIFGVVVFSTLCKVQIGSPTYKQIVMIKDVNADYVAPGQSLAVAVVHAVKMEEENTGGAVSAVGGIKDVIDKISHISTVIATAVEEKSATTNEMSRNVAEAARGAGTISNSIQRVADEAQTATEQLSRMAIQLHDLVGQFKLAGKSSRQHNTLLRAAGHAAGKS